MFIDLAKPETTALDPSGCADRISSPRGNLEAGWNLSQGPAAISMYAAKRWVDLTLSVTVLCLLSVPMLVVAGLVRVLLGSPVLFRQVRPGLNAKPFTMIKFRTMTDERDPDGHLLPDGLRLTAFGRLLRVSSVDELPALLNVLRGDMSLVGPRPLLMRYVPFFSDTERCRFKVRPGVTGWAQVNGRNSASWDERLSMDVWYVDNSSLALDLRILGMTAVHVIRRSGVVVDASAAMDDLDVERSRERLS